jgi:DNA-binding transcriptional regulator YiaG
MYTTVPKYKKRMTGAEMRQIRRKLGLNIKQWALALGYRGKRNTLQKQVSRWEFGDRPIPVWIERLARMYEKHGVPRTYYLEPPLKLKRLLHKAREKAQRPNATEL